MFDPDLFEAPATLRRWEIVGRVVVWAALGFAVLALLGVFS